MVVLCIFVLDLKDATCTNVSLFCNDAKSCYEELITWSEGNVNCYGDYSCASASLIEQSGTHNIRCNGAYSCFESTKLVGINNSSRINCHGLYSCAFIYNITSFGSVHCYGELSCFGSIIDNSSEYSSLYCYGDRSCANSTIKSPINTYLYGHLSGHNTTFITDNTTTYVGPYNKCRYNYYFYGAFSGYQTTIYCGLLCTCYVYCDDATCRDYMTLVCDGGGGCAYGFNYDGYGGNPAAYIYSSASSTTFTLQSIENVTSMSNLDNSGNGICESTTSDNINEFTEDVKNCGNYQECANTTNVKLNHENNTICCTAFESCYGAMNITADLDSKYSSGLDYGVAVRCDGSSSCQYAKSIVGREINGGNIYFSGYNSGTINNLATSIVKTTNDSNIFCNGDSSCINKGIAGGNNLYCGGRKSCSSSWLIEYVSNIYAYGYDSASGASVANVYDNIYCGSVYSCSHSRINNVGGDVIGIAKYGLYNSTISNINGSIFGGGWSGLAYSIIDNVTNNVYCLYQTSCKSVTFRNVYGTIYATGNNSLAGARIISTYSSTNAKIETDKTLIVDINSTNDMDSIYLYCNKSDTCKIDCKGAKSCTKLYLECQGSCYVNCDNSGGIDCPASGNYHTWTITTGSPTGTTLSPTFKPSVAPTTPSVNPTSSPTVNDSSMNASPTGSPVFATVSMQPTSIESHVSSSSVDSNGNVYTSTSGNNTNGGISHEENGSSDSESKILKWLDYITYILASVLLVFTIMAISFSIRLSKYRKQVSITNNYKNSNSNGNGNDELLIRTITIDDNDYNRGKESIASKSYHDEIVNYQTGFGTKVRHQTIALIALAIFDVYTDAAYCYTLIYNGYVGEFYGFLGCMIIAWVLNFLLVTMIWNNEFRTNRAFVNWFYRHNGIFMGWLRLLSFTDISLLSTVFTSKIFGNHLFQAPFTMKSIAKLKVSCIVSIFLENIPQFIIQIIVVVNSNEYKDGEDSHSAVTLATLVVTAIDIILAIDSVVLWKALDRGRKSMERSTRITE